MAGVPIITDNGYRLTDNFYLRNLKLTLTEALSLILAVSNFKKTAGNILVGSLNGAVDKIMATVPAELRLSVKAASVKILVGVNAPVDYSPFKQTLSCVDRACEKSLTLEVKYKGPGKQTSIRLIDPYGMVVRGGFCYLTGYCHSRREIRMFRLDRIVKLRMTDKRFQRPDDFSLAGYMADSWRVVHGPKTLIKVRFSGRAAYAVKEAKWHKSQRIVASDDDSLIATYTISGLSEICAWLLSFGGEAEVLKPLELRQMVAKTARAAAKKNN